MVKSVYVPEAGGIIDFADDITPQEISSYISRKYPSVTAPAAAPEPSYDNSGVLGRFAYGLGTGISDVPGGIASLLYTAEEAKKTSAGQFSEEARKYLQETFGIDPTKDPTTAQWLAETLGSAASFLVPGGAAAKGVSLAGKGVALAARAGTVTAGAQGVALGAGSRAQTIEQQLASGMEISPEQQLASQRLSGLFGASQALPMQKFFGPINTILSKVPASKANVVEKIIQSRLAKVTKAGAQEAAQEVAEGIANDLMEYGVYNPDVQIGQDILSNAGGGAFAGSAIEGVIQLAAGRKLRGYRQLQADLKAEQAQNLADLNQASVAQAAERLRATGIEGELDIQPNEDIDGNIRYTITSPTGEALVDTISENEAAAAVDMYKAKTGANVSLKVTQAPKLNMIRIGSERFPSIEAAEKKRQSLRKYVRDLDSYFSNIELVSKHAAEKGQPPRVYAKQIDDTLKSARNKLAQFDAYFEAPTPTQAAPKITPAPAQPTPVAAAPTTPPPAVAAAPVTAAPVEAAPTVEVPVAPVQPVGGIAALEAPEAPVEALEAPIAPEPITEEEQVPEMPIGAVELPVEESRVLPDTIVETEVVPQEVDVEPAATQTVKRPSATDEQLTALKTELFGKPIGYKDMTPEQLATYEAERDKRYPPVDTDVYLAAGPTGETAPRNIREAATNNPVARNYTPEVQEWMKKVYAGVQARLDAIVPEAAKAELKTLIPSPVGTLARGLESGVETQYGIKSIVDLSIGILKPGMSVDAAVKQLVEIVNHEIIHVITRKGVLRPAEWRMLSRAAANTKVPGKKYTYLDKAEAIYTPNGNPISPEYADPEAVVEEAVAEMYRDWVKKGTGQKNINGLFNRITEFFRRIFQALRGAGYDDVFKRIESGEIGRREGSAKTGAARMSAVPTGVMAGSQDPQNKEFLTVASFPEGNIGSSTVYLRRDYDRFKAPGRRKDESWGAALDRAFIDKFGRTLDINNPADYAQIVASVSDEVKHQMKQAQSGVGWYDDDIKKVFEKLAATFPVLKDPDDGPAYRQMFTMIAGVMSNGMKAKANVELAAINFAHFLNTGKFSPIHPFTETGWNQRSNIMGPQIDMLNSMIDDDKFAPREGSNNPRLERIENFLEFMFSTHPVREINQFRAKHGTKSPAKIGKQDDVRLGMYAFGPKFGPFILNLNGLSDETVDSWASRSFYRNMGRSIGADGQLVKGPLTNNDRESMKRALRDVSAQTNLSSRDIQAVLWFYEKELYNHLGQKIPLEVFSDGATEFDRKYGAGAQGPLQSRSDRERRIVGAVKAAGTQTSQTAPRGARFSAAPLPQYVAERNETLFAKTPKTSFRDTMFGYFLGQRPMGKTLKTLDYGDIELSSTKMAAIAGRTAVVESGAYMRELESLLNQKETGNFQRRDADASATAALAWRRRSGHLTASMMMRGKLTLNFQTPGDIMSATMKVENDPDSLKEIFKVLNEEGPVNPVTGERETKATIFRSYAVAKRGEWLRATGQNVPRELTPQYIRESIATAQQYPEVIEAYEKYQRFNKNLLTTAKDAGLISQAELGRLTNQMNYYGFIYEVYGEPLGPTSPQKTASRFKLRAYTGSARGGLVNDPMFVMIQNAQFWVDSIAKNLAAMKSFDVARQMGEARILATGEDPNEAEGEAPDVMFFSQNGVVKRFAVKDPLLVIALGSDDRVTVGKFWEALGLPAHILRESVTRDPGFMARNLLRDTLSSWITSGVDFTPVIGTVKGFATSLKDGASFQDLASRGVVGSYDLAMMGPEEISATFKRNAMPMNVKMATSVEGLSAAGISLWNRLGNVSEASDAATRIAVYDALIAQGKSEAEAAMQAIELLDFTRRGASQTLSILTKLIPFLNARIQGMDVLYQASRAGIRYATGQSLGERDANVGKKFLVRGAMLAAIAVALEAMNDGDEDYEQLDEYIKNGNFIIPLKHFGLPGQFIAVPKPFEAGTLFATIPQQMYKTTTGDASTRQNAQLFWDQFSATFGVNPIPQFLLPSIEIITNHNFYTGLPLISEGKSRLSPELQYNTGTSQLAMMIGGLPIFYDFTTGKFTGMSPIVIDKLISGYGGPIGTYMVEAVSLGMESANVGPDRMPRELTRLPVVKSFFIDAKSKNPKVVTQAYELFQIADEVNRTVSRMKQMRDVEALTAYVEENKDVLTYKKYIFALADNLNKLSAQERSIERDSTMTREEKLAAQRRLRETRIQLASKVDEINRKLGR